MRLALLVKIFNFEVDPSLLVFELGFLLTIIWTIIKMYFKIGELKDEIKNNRTANAAEIGELKNEIKNNRTANAAEITKFHLLLDEHSKNDEAKFSQILSSLSDISSNLAVVVDRVGLIINGKLGK